MNRRLQQFIAAENLSQSQFADAIGVARASVSHILAGRNKPGFDFIVSMSSHYPTLNLEWLINGKGKMYKTDANSPAISTTPPIPSSIPIYNIEEETQTEVSEQNPESDNLFSEREFHLPAQEQVSPTFPGSPAQDAPVQTSPIPNPPVQNSPVFKEHQNARTAQTEQNDDILPHTIQKIIVFYSDNTFQELK